MQEKVVFFMLFHYDFALSYITTDYSACVGCIFIQAYLKYY